MASDSSILSNISPDILRLIFDQLAGDYPTLCNVSLTCRAWRTHSWPSLLQVVDLSSHNNGRQRQYESNVLPVVHADHDGKYRQPNLVPRQRAFLRLITTNEGLAKYVQSLTWTLIWKDFNESTLTTIDRQTWHVFGRMENVTYLDLASLHDVESDNLVRQNPGRLFPAVTELRLLGWMHRGLVRAIVSSLDTRSLRRLRFDYLEDEGALPNGDAMPASYAVENAPHADAASEWPSSADIAIAKPDVAIDDELLKRQEDGSAPIFPGPMWMPLRFLANQELQSLAHLQIQFSGFDGTTDLRNYHTYFQAIADLIVAARQRLASLILFFGEDSQFSEGPYLSGCGTGWIRFNSFNRPWATKMAAAFLALVLRSLNTHEFPCLTKVNLDGFYLLKIASPELSATLRLADVFEAAEQCPYIDETFNETPSPDHRFVWHGYDL